MKNPLVSILIPVYNGKNFLKEAIESALAQTYKNIEIIVINDGSEDDGATEKIALSYGEKIRYIRKDNGGVASALNLGIENMFGEYFSWLSHDDLYYPEKVKVQIEHLKKTGDIKTIVYSNYEILDMKSQATTKLFFEKNYSLERVKNPIFSLTHGLVHGCSLLIHKSHFDRVGAFDVDLITTQDYDLWFRMFRGQKLEFIPDILVVSREHDARGSKTIECHSKEVCNLIMKFFEKLTDEEICLAYGTKYNFYYNMSMIYRNNGMDDAYKWVIEKYKNEKTPSDLFEKLLKFKEYIDSLSNGNAKRICIFGCGCLGTRMSYNLKNRHIPVECFVDNDKKKWGKFLDGKSCISPKELQKIKEDTLVIVAVASSIMIEEQLKHLEFPYVTTVYELEIGILETPPLRVNEDMQNKN